jgi:thymidine kinase
VFNTKVNFEQLIAMINDDFGLDGTGRDKVTLLKDLYHFLIEEHRKGLTPVLIIDEAQNLTPTVLEEVRMLSNLETSDAKLLQIVLVGQPELAAVLSLDELRQLRQRISVVCRLSPLTRRECEEYIYHRLAVAGNREAVWLPSEVLDSIYAYSDGIPRLVNSLCNFILLSAFAEETHTISREMVADIINELQTEWRDCGKDECAAAKRASREARGSAAADKGPIAAPVQGTDSPNAEEDIRLLFEDMSLRIAAIEKAHVRVEAHKLDDMMHRLELVEKSRLENAAVTQARITTPTSPAKSGSDTPPVSAASPNKQGDTNPKKSLLKRLVGSGQRDGRAAE